MALAAAVAGWPAGRRKDTLLGIGTRRDHSRLFGVFASPAAHEKIVLPFQGHPGHSFS